MKNKCNLFNGLLLILFSVGFGIAQKPEVSGTRVPAHQREISKMNKPMQSSVQVVNVAVKMEGNRILGIRSLGEKRELGKDEVQARAVTDGDSMILAFETRFKDLDKAGIAVEKEILIDEETSKALGSNVFSILDGKYPLQSRESPNPGDTSKQHGRIWSIIRPTPEHNIYKTMGLPGRGEFLEVEVSNLKNEKEFPKSVLVTIKDGNLLNIKVATGNEKIESKDVYPAKASFVNTQLVLEFKRPLSREEKVELKTKGDLISEKETAENLGFCACREGNSIVVGANTSTPIVKFPIIGKVKHHRWLFNKTKYINTTVCEMFGQRKKWWL